MRPFVGPRSSASPHPATNFVYFLASTRSFDKSLCVHPFSATLSAFNTKLVPKNHAWSKLVALSCLLTFYLLCIISQSIWSTSAKIQTLLKKIFGSAIFNCFLILTMLDIIIQSEKRVRNIYFFYRT